MKLDTRIMGGKKPLDCFDTDEAESYVGKECYFSDDLFSFEDMSDKTNDHLIYKGILLKVSADGSDPYETDLNRFYKIDSIRFFAYCLPCEWVTEEKKYRPFRYINELQECGLKAGKVLAVRNSNYPEVTSSVIVSEVNYNPETLEVINITLGATGYEFSTLFNSYLFQVNGEWRPFGVSKE